MRGIEECDASRNANATIFEPYSDPKNSPLGPRKVKNDPKIKSKSKFKIEGTKEDISFSITG